ncbi:hypothetical protein INS49_012247 [Diaporthe citri]|uniref:uncharacterized protein n=1 Tax=Diaporthe citri TaxID=83186 RepID=UPI001C80E0D6|nr:uncharacterized protein INS49_012247 [Diaporthe citri]KAG6358728.1 hypothetical protein INS49_012247 [Diaporthe citri]
MSDIDSDTVSVPIEEQQTLDLVHQLLRSFQNGRSGMVFACGGKVPIPVANTTAQQTPMNMSSAPICPPVILRWDPGSTSIPAAECKLEFPLDHSVNTTVNNMKQLLRDMQPATYGYQGQDVLDESYRKASKLDPSHFACTFSPHELGIIDEVARILLPGFEDKTKPKKYAYTLCEPQIQPVSVMRSELYKLNVYAGPSGHFKAHVDTPRSTEQIGSLVVCLPCVHQGGQLEVRHEGRTMTFDWSMPETARPEIQWAAFYSDCEHEVMEVTSGHRITLTYNLYASSITGSPQVGNGLLDSTQLQSHGILHSLFLQENFMPDGGYLGVHTSHAYPHTSKSSRLPSTLKGADMVAWETFRSLGCGVRLRPVGELSEFDHYGHKYDEPCPAADFTDTSSEGDRSHTDNEELMYPPSEPEDKEADSDDVDSDEVNSGDVDSSKGSDDDQPMAESGPLASGSDTNAVHASQQDEGDQPMAEQPGPPASGSDHLVTDSVDTQAAQVGYGDQPMVEVPKPSPIGPERWMIDADEVEALQQELKEYQSLPNNDFQGLEPAGRLIPRRKIDEKDEEVAEAEFEKIGLEGGCRVLGNGLSFHIDRNLIEDDVEMGALLDRWIDRKASRQERTAKQPGRVLYEEVAWLNHCGIHKEPQISYGIYGNEAETAIMYSTCGIVAEVPPYTTRKALLRKE